MRTLSTLALIALSLGACRKEEAELPVDLDGDGYDATVDCDDHNVQVHPDAEELCNLVDDNCDGVVDTDATDAGEWYADVDGDGFGDEGSLTTACEVPSGHTDVGGDCDDTDPAFHPGALEADCADPADYNCDGSVGYADADGDGFAACEECDDGDSAVNPDAPETCNLVDDDCDRQVDEDALDATLWYADLDGDGFAGEAITERACQSPDGFMAEATDCDDTSASTFPGADERCDGADNDCDSAVDEEAVDMRAFYADADADHYGDAAHTLRACEVPEGYVTNDDDCDDGSTGSHPGATEVCDGLDNDCDQEVDESSAVDAATWYPDGDGDGFGDRTGALRACEAPEGYVSLPGDCDDGEAAAWPGNAEICDAVDNNCNGVVDDNAADAATWYQDEDGDRYGVFTSSTRACAAPAGYVSLPGDCDDGEAAAWPGNAEICDAVDNNCNGVVDDNAADAATWYQDEDGDRYGVFTSSTRACAAPAGYTALPGDCDDTTSARNPSQAEVCDDLDNDCDGGVDEDAADISTWYFDRDGDDYGDPTIYQAACEAPDARWVLSDLDCDDDNAEVNPSMTEACDGLDNNCDGDVDVAEDPDLLGVGEACPARSCLDVRDTRVTPPGDGVYWVEPGLSTAFETWCDMTTDGGGWTLVLSVVDGDAKRGSDDPTQYWQQAGYNRWQDASVFGHVSTATVSNSGSYKNPAYWELEASNLMIYHTPNDGAVEDYHSQALYAYHTEDSFLDANGGTLYDLYNDYYPLVNATGWTGGLTVDVVYDIGVAEDLWAEQMPNNEASSLPGGISLSTRNGEGYPFALCPVKWNGHNAEHSCVGGNGTTGAYGRGGWGNLREWNFNSDWGFTSQMRTATMLVFTR